MILPENRFTLFRIMHYRFEGIATFRPMPSGRGTAL
jgi:hypothetical protein